MLTFIGKHFHYLTYLGLLVWLMVFLMPSTILALTPMTDFSILLIFILPSLGLISLVLSILYRRLYMGLVSLALMAAFPITMFLGYLLLGP